MACSAARIERRWPAAHRSVRLHMTMGAVLLTGALGMVLALPSVASEACPNLSGRYRILGEWTTQNPLPDGSRPRADEWAFAFVARRIIDPSFVEVVHRPPDGGVAVDVIGAGTDPSWTRESPLKLPHKQQLRCSTGGWILSQTSKGGGDNTPSTMETRITLALDKEGRLIASGSREITSGYFIQSKTSSQWTAVFAKMAH
jgi:hypothetical protein